MKQRYWTVGFNYYYSELNHHSEVVYGTEERAKAYILAALDKQPDWLKNSVDKSFNSISNTKVFIRPLKVVKLLHP